MADSVCRRKGSTLYRRLCHGEIHVVRSMHHGFAKCTINQLFLTFQNSGAGVDKNIWWVIVLLHIPFVTNKTTPVPTCSHIHRVTRDDSKTLACTHPLYKSNRTLVGWGPKTIILWHTPTVDNLCRYVCSPLRVWAYIPMALCTQCTWAMIITRGVDTLTRKAAALTCYARIQHGKCAEAFFRNSIGCVIKPDYSLTFQFRC